MSDLRTAALRALDALSCLEYSFGGITEGPSDDTTEDAITALKEALAAEPGLKQAGVVTSMVKGGVTWHIWPDQMPDGTKIYAAAPIIQSEIKEDKQPAQSIDKTDIRTVAAKALEALDCTAKDLRKVLTSRPQPYAWMYVDETGMKFVSVDRPHLDCVPLYTRP